jgi:citrate lyase subunit beta/citryl-CoA lyase
MPDGIILDLEDSVAPESKSDARILVRNALHAVDFQGSERMVRINQLPMGLEDLDEIIPASPNMILIPKVESPEEIMAVEERVVSRQKECFGKIREEPYFMPIIESARGILFSFQIAQTSSRTVALAIGLEDYTADLGTRRTKAGNESLFARQMLVNAAKASGIQAIDTVFSDVGDMEGLRESVREARALGFDGKGCIHPRQIGPINEGFLPDETEIERACRIVRAFEKAEAEGRGVVALGTKMIDPPVVKRALRIVKLAEDAGMLKKKWREEDE